MEIAFRKNSNTIPSKLIRWWTKSPYSHCELVFKNGLTFSAFIEDFRTDFKSASHDPSEWDIIEIPIDLETEYKIYQFCVDEDNCLYDIVGLTLTQFLPLGFENPWWWFCSEICVAALHRAGMLLDIVPHLTDPGTLAKLLNERLLTNE
jgi:hypothetical protein